MNRVLHVFHLCGTAGTEAVIRYLVRGLAQQGIQSEAFFERDLGGSSLFRELCPIHFGGADELTELLASGRFDAVHAVTSSITLGVPEAVTRSGFTGPVIAGCHNDYITGWNRCNTDLVVALTECWAGYIRPYTDLPLRVVGNPIDIDHFSPPRERRPASRPILGWAGRLQDPLKNAERFKQIVAALPPDAFEVHVADANYRPDLEAVFGPVASRIAWYGKLGPGEMPEFYRRVAASGGVLLSTSDSEAFPMCVLEAMSCGCPIVAPDAWGSDEIVEEGVVGFVYRRQDCPGSAVTALLESVRPDRWSALSTAARGLVEERYSLEAITHRYLELFQEASRQPRRRSLLQRLAWSLRAATFCFKPRPDGVWLYRPRRAEEIFERAMRANSDGQAREVRLALLAALCYFPPVYSKPWRAKFLLRNLLRSA